MTNQEQHTTRQKMADSYRRAHKIGDNKLKVGFLRELILSGYRKGEDPEKLIKQYLPEFFETKKEEVFKCKYCDYTAETLHQLAGHQKAHRHEQQD